MQFDYMLPEHGAMVIRFEGQTTYVNKIGGRQFVRTVNSEEERRILRRIFCRLLIDEVCDDEPDFPDGFSAADTKWNI